VAAASRGLDGGGGLMGAAAPYSQGLDLAAAVLVASQGTYPEWWPGARWQQQARTGREQRQRPHGGSTAVAALLEQRLCPRWGLDLTVAVAASRRAVGHSPPPPFFGFLKIVTSVVPTKDTYLPSVADETYISLIYILLSARDR
jgi:hypothetical protein